MIDGVTILKEYDYSSCPWWGVVLCCLTIGLIVFVIISCGENESPIMGTIVAVILMTLVFIIVGLTSNWFATTKRYEVTIDNNVSYNDLIEKYDIIEQDGLIITLEEKVSSD